MAVKDTFSSEELCPTFGTGNQTTATWYLPTGETLRVGVIVYTDYALTTKLGANKSKGATFNGRNYFFTTGTNGEVTSLEECTVTVQGEVLVVTPDLTLGEVTYNSNGTVNQVRSRLAVTDNASQFIVNDTVWDSSNFEDINSYNKVCYLGTDTNTGVIGKTLKNVNLEDMRGFDLTAWIGYMKKNPVWDAGRFIHQHIHVPTRAGQNRRKWREGDVEYNFMPEEYVFSGGHIPKFMTLNDFTLPSGVHFFTQLKLKGVDPKLYLNKGCTHVPDNTAPQSKIALYDYDAWAYQAGCPAHGGGRTTQDVENWLTNVDTNTLVNSFMGNFGNHFKNYAYAIMDYEAIGFANPYIGGKLQACFTAWKNSNPTAKLGAWGHKFMGYSRVDIEGNYYPAQMTADLNFGGNLADFISQRDPASPVSLHHEIYRNMLDVFYIGGYHNFPTNYGFLEHALMELMLMQKLAPNKETLITYWYNVEYVGNGFPLGDSYFKKNNGTPLKFGTKPMTFPHDMWNVGVFFLSEKMSGVDLWSDPYPRSDNPDYYGDGKMTTDVNGGQIADSYENIGTGFSVYTNQNYRCVDWLFGAGKRISENKDVIEASGGWQFCDYSKDGGANWVTGDERLPSKTIYTKNPLCQYKTNQAGTQALLRVVNQHGDPTKMVTLKCRIGSKTFDVKVFGRYATLARIYNL